MIREAIGMVTWWQAALAFAAALAIVLRFNYRAHR